MGNRTTRGCSLNIWLLRDSESLPIYPQARVMRMGQLAQTLLKRGHQVTWWSSNFDHFQKKRLFNNAQKLFPQPGLTLRLLDAGSYQRNFSWARIRHNERLAKAFMKESAQLTKPDVIVAAFPTIELADAAVRYAKMHYIPIIVDVRDPWPDSFETYFPLWLRPFIRLGTQKLQYQARRCLRDATSLVSMSPHLLTWALRKAKPITPPTALFYLGAQDPRVHQSASQLSPILAERTQGKTVFTFIGSFGHAYDFQPLIEVAHRSYNKGLNAFFILAGSGPQWQKVAESVPPNMIILPWQNAEESRALFCHTHVTLIPCFFDALPNKLGEALSYGHPVIASGPPNASMKFLFKTTNAGFFYTQVNQLEHHVCTLVQNPTLRQSMGVQARLLYERHFNSEKVYNNYAQYIEVTAVK